jgi:hypothetical protein
MLCLTVRAVIGTCQAWPRGGLLSRAIVGSRTFDNELGFHSHVRRCWNEFETISSLVNPASENTSNAKNVAVSNVSINPEDGRSSKDVDWVLNGTKHISGKSGFWRNRNSAATPFHNFLLVIRRRSPGKLFRVIRYSDGFSGFENESGRLPFILQCAHRHHGERSFIGRNSWICWSDRDVGHDPGPLAVNYGVRSHLRSAGLYESGYRNEESNDCHKCADKKAEFRIVEGMIGGLILSAIGYVIAYIPLFFFDISEEFPKTRLVSCVGEFSLLAIGLVVFLILVWQFLRPDMDRENPTQNDDQRQFSQHN